MACSSGAEVGADEILESHRVSNRRRLPSNPIRSHNSMRYDGRTAVTIVREATQVLTSFETGRSASTWSADDACAALLKEVSEGSADAEAELTLRYRPLVRSLMRRFFMPGHDRADLEQEAMIGLLKAIRSYDRRLDPSFENHLTRCVRNRIMSAVRSATRKRHRLLNEAASLDCFRWNHKAAVYDPVSYEPGPEDVVVRRLTLEHTFELARAALSTLERDVLIARALGFTYDEITSVTGFSSKQTENLLYRARTKLKRHCVDAA